MRRTWLGTVVLLLFAGLASPAGPPTNGKHLTRRAGSQLVAGREAVAHEALVKFRVRASAATLQELRADADAELVEAIGGRGVLRVRSRSKHAADLVAQLSRRGDVLYAEPNYVVRVQEHPNDPGFPDLWGLSNVGQPVNGGLPGAVDADIGAVAAWDITVGTTSHVVGVVDTGVDYTHPDLAANMWSAPASFTVDVGSRRITCEAGTHGFNAIKRTCDPMDDHMHGTHVAGTIGAVGNDGNGVVGVNWTTRMMALKFLDADGSGTVADAVDAIRFAIEARRTLGSGADVRVLSNSWGDGGFSQALLDEIEAAGAEGMLFVAAAGNDGMDNDILPFYPASYTASNVVAVAATTNRDVRAYFSNYGATSVDLGAPGEEILSTTPGNGYKFASGTSMATPHVSGAAALVLSRCTLDTVALKDVLLSTVHSLAGLSSSTVSGGRLDVNSAVHSCVAPPDAPAGLTAAGFDARVRLTWSASVGATGYVVRRSTTAGGPRDEVATGVKGETFTDATVTNGTTYYYVVSATNALGESGDSNEAAATPNPPSDLVVANLIVPKAAGAGSAIAVSVTTSNAGSAPAAASTTRLYLSANALLDATDVPLEPAQEVPPLPPGVASTASLTLPLPPDLAAGYWYLIAAADAVGAIYETQETNNTALRSVSLGPDLVVSALDVPSAAAAGAAITVTDAVKNQGAGSAGTSVTLFYLSSNSAFDAGDALLGGGRAVPSLEPNASSAGTTTLTIPAGTVAGQYYVIARADAAGAVAECWETNNTFARSVGVGADLSVAALTVPATAGAGLSISVAETTKNQGTGAAASTLTRFYLSGNYLLDATDTEVGSRVVPALAAGASSMGTSMLAIPPGTPTASYYVIAVADAQGSVPESSESNNQLFRVIQIGGDLKVSSLTAPGAAGPGSTIVVGDTTANQGGGAVGPTTTTYYLSNNGLLDAADQMLGGRAVPALGPGVSHTGSASVTIPAGTVTGTFYIIAKADANGIAAETQESNNTSLRSILVGGDLAVTALSAPSRTGAGKTITVSDTVVNQGAAAVPGSVTRFYLSANAVLDASDVPLPAGRAVPALAAGASSTGSATLTIPAGAATGQQYVLAQADGDGAVVETQEANNTYARTISVGPDLAMSVLAVPAKSASGFAISVTDTTTNEGGGEAAASVTTFHLSTDWTLDAGDITLAGTRSVPPLAPGAASSGATGVTIPAGTAAGTYYLFATADGRGGVNEVTEANNTRSQMTRVGPDLVVSTAWLPSSTIEAGSMGTVSATVANQGAGLAPASTARFYLSVNSTWESTDAPLAGVQAITPLATGATSAATTIVTVPVGTAGGTYYVLARADADDAVSESLENNNVRLVRRIDVTSP